MIYDQNTKAQKWYIKPLEGCICSDGKHYMISLKKGIVDKLIVNFVGGGMSWNEETAAKPLTASAIIGKKEYFYISSVSPMTMRLMHVGILKANDVRNPFRDWYVLNIPYATADFHIGCNEYSYRNAKGENKILYHHGNKNVDAALALLKDFYKETPEALVIMGESGGAFGCVAHCPKIKNLYPDCDNIIVYSDGSHLHSPLWQEIANNIWKVGCDLRAYIKSDDLIYDLFRYARDNMPSHTKFLHSNSVWDKELTEFMSKMNHDKKLVNPSSLLEFHNTLKDTVKRLKKEIPNYSYYLTDYGKSKKDRTTPHTFVGTPRLLYSKMQEGKSIVDWLSKAVGKESMDIGEKFIV